MRQIRITVEDGEFEKLMKVKGKLTWREFILLGVDYANS